MAYNRKMRKFEGTCYIPGEQLAMMAKYYRGANLNLNLTLFEEDLATMQDTLDQACWCSKLDEVDRMKMSHMKGNEWRIAHDHCLEGAEPGLGPKNPKVYPALPERSKSTVGKVERGTSAVSLYDRERGLVRDGRYQRDDCSEPHNRRTHFPGRRYRRDDYNDPRDRRGYYLDDRNAREDYYSNFHRYDYPSQPELHTKVFQNVKQTDRNMRAPPDGRYEIESEAAISSLPEIPGEIKCAVCNVETCLVCKNHLYSPICQCKCLVANAGLCRQCNPKPCEEEEEAAQETGRNKIDMSSMMLTMMMSSMLKQSQAPESVCRCNTCRNDSESSSSNSLDEKVHKVYLYDCEDQKKKKKSTRKSKKTSSDSSSACDCCKCSRKLKKNSGKKEKLPKTSDEQSKSSESDGGEMNGPTKENNIKGSKVKPAVQKHKANESSQEDDSKVNSKDLGMKALRMDEDRKSMKENKRIAQRSNVQVSIDSKNFQFLTAEKSSPRKKQGLSSSETDAPKEWLSSERLPPRLAAQTSELLDTQHNVPDLESSNHTKKDGDTDVVGEESSTEFSLREFIVCLPKIQSNLQSLMSKLNQMDLLNNQLPYQQVDPSLVNAQLCVGEMPTCNDIPLIPSQQNPLSNSPSFLYKGLTQLDNQYKQPDSNLPPTISLGSSKEPKVHKQSLNPPTHTQYQSTVNVSNLGESPGSSKLTADHRKYLPASNEFVSSTKPTQSTFKMSLNVGGTKAKEIIESQCGNQWSFKKGNQLVHLPEQGLPNSGSGHITDKSFCERKHGETNQYQKGCKLDEDGVRSLSNQVSTGSSHNVEITELPETTFCNYGNGNNLFRKSINEILNTNTAVTMPSRYDGDTIFQSYNRSSAETSIQDPTDYASFYDEKCNPLSLDTSAQQNTYDHRNEMGRPTPLALHSYKPHQHDYQKLSIFSKCSPNLSEEPTLRSTRSVLRLRKRMTFKAKKKNALSLEKLVRGCTLRGSKTPLETRKNSNNGQKAESSENSSIKVNQSIGPGIFCRSKFDSSLDPPSGKTLHKNEIESSENHKMRTIKSKRSISPYKVRCNVDKNNLPPKRKTSLDFGKLGFQNIHTNFTADETLKMSDAYVKQEMGSQSYIVSSVKVQAANKIGSSTDILNMVQGIATRSLVNVSSVNMSSVAHQTGTRSSDGFDIIPLLPLSSTTPVDGTESRSENQSTAIVRKQASFDDEASSNTPAFLRRSLVQVEQLKRANETIRSMIKNVNEVITHIDSDSKIGIKSKVQSEDKERQSYFVHLSDDDSKKPCESTEINDLKRLERDWPGNVSELGHSSNKPNLNVQEMFLSVNRVINSVLTPSEQSNLTEESYLQSENSTPVRAHRDFFVLNSESSSTAFTESLRRSLENDTSHSVPLAAQRVPSPEWETSQRPRSIR